jgi:hypothetical protein
MALSAGQVLRERYRIEALLGQGGMGAVYRGTDETFGAPVAIKENRRYTPESEKQFAREAGLLHRLRHPNLPRVTDYFAIPGSGQYLVMDYVEGEDLKQMLAQRGPIAEGQAVAWIGKVLEALEFLHSQAIIHRDVKPANVKITPEGQVYLVDFGLAKTYDPEQMTTMGARGVTPGYAPPEQYGMGRTDARADIYSAAATLYALLAGQPPADALECLTGLTQLVPPSQLGAAVSPGTEAAVLRAMQPRPADRFQTASGFRSALQAAPAAYVPTQQAAPPAALPPDALEPTIVADLTPGPAPAGTAPQPASPAPHSRPRPEVSPRAAVAAGRPKRRRLPVWFWLLVAVALLLAVGIGYAALNLMGPSDTVSDLPAARPSLPTATLAQPAAEVEPTPQPLPQEEPPPEYPAPTLEHPPAEPVPELHGEVVFAWRFPLELRPGEAYQLLVWPTEGAGPEPALEPWPNWEVVINLDKIPQVRERGPGEFFWSVVVVSAETQERISPVAEPRPFFYIGPAPDAEGGPLPAPTLVDPPPGAELGEAAGFAWEWPHEPLGEGQYFDLRIWAMPEAELPPGERSSAGQPTRQHHIEVELPGVPTLTRHGDGEYFWTVVVVEQPCPDCPPEIVGEWGEERPFFYLGPPGP